MKMIYILLGMLFFISILAILRSSRRVKERFTSSGQAQLWSGNAFSLSQTRSLINFMTLPEARQVFLSDDFAFHRLYSRAESIAKTKLTTLPESNWHVDVQQCYLDNVQEFSETEKKGITGFIERYDFLRRQSWKFIKMPDHMDFSFPYTLGECVVMPAHLVKSIASLAAQKENFKTLCHENLHILQRSNPSVFRKYYQSAWNYLYDPELFIGDRLRQSFVTNPDGYERQGGWVAKIGNDEFYYCLCLNENDLQLSRRAYKVIRTPGKRIVDDSKFFPLENFSSYQRGVKNCYHPNEEYAYIMSQKYTDMYFDQN